MPGIISRAANSWIHFSASLQANCLDLRSLAAFRILLGLYILYDVYSRTKLGKYDLHWYTENPEERSFLRPTDTPHGAPLHKFWFYRGSFSFQISSFVVLAILAAMFGAGFCCNALVKAPLFVVYTAVQCRNMLVHDGSDAFVRHLVFWSCFLPVSEVWSLDAVVAAARWRQKDAQEQKKTKKRKMSYSSIACLAVTLQIVLMYLGTIFQRTFDLYSWNTLSRSEWMPPRLSAVHNVLSGSFAARKNWMTDLIRSNAAVSRMLTAKAMAVETFAPVGCILGGVRSRHWFAALLFLFHAGLLATINLPNWQFVAMLTQVLWVPAHVWDRLISCFERNVRSTGGSEAAAAYKKTDGDLPTNGEKRSNSKPSEKKHLTFAGSASLIKYASLLVQIFWFAYMVYNWLGNRGWIAKHDGGDIGEGLRLSQYWVMFSTVGKRAHNTMLTGYNRDGVNNVTLAWDLFRYISTGDFVPQEPTDSVAQDMTSRYPSPRWERALSQMAASKERHRAAHVAGALCLLINEDRLAEKLAPLSVVEFRWKDFDILPPGSSSMMMIDQRYDGKGLDTVVSVPCHKR